MHFRSCLAALSALSALILLPVASAQPTTPASEPPASEAAAEAKALVARIVEKLRAGERSEAALAKELAEFDALVERQRETNPDEAAQLLASKAILYLQVFNNSERGIEILRDVESQFAGTDAASAVPRIIAQIEEREAAARVKSALVGQAAPELTFTWASREGLTTLSGLKGKVVVLDFWATWCGPCVASFPQIKELTEHYRGFPVEIVGVTSLQGRVHGLEAQPIDCAGDAAKETGLMPRYMEAKDINWTIAFSQEEVFNPDFGVTGIPHMAIVGPDGVVRHNGIHPGALPLAEKARLIDALLKDAGLPTPKPL